MFLLPFFILLAMAAACFGLNRLVDTRALGYGAAAAAGVAALALLVAARGRSLPIESSPLSWLTVDSATIQLVLRLDAPALALSVLLLLCGALALLALAAALGARLRGFGALFGYGLLALAAALGTLCSGTALMLPYAWALLALVGFAAAWSSGAPSRNPGVALGLGCGLLACLLLLAGLLPGLGSGWVVACMLLAVLLAAGLPPFQRALDDLLAGPAALGGLLAGLGLPLVAPFTLWRLLASGALQAQTWALPLLVAGTLAVLVCAAAALRERQLKTLLGWQLSGQGGAVLVALGLGALAPAEARTGAYDVAWPLISNLVITTLAGALALAPLERRGGGEYGGAHGGAAGGHGGTALQGVVWAIAGASAAGLPPLWGFWGRRWLVEMALERAPWVVPVLLAGSTLALLACLMSLSAFWGQAAGAEAAGGRPRAWGDWLGLLPAGLCVLLGVAPGLGWPLPPAVGVLEQAACIGVLALALVLGLLLRRSAGARHTTDPDMLPVALAPEGLGDSLAALGWLGRPDELRDALWRGLLGLGTAVQAALGPFERRYYLAGVLLALISLLLLIAGAGG